MEVVKQLKIVHGAKRYFICMYRDRRLCRDSADTQYNDDTKNSKKDISITRIETVNSICRDSADMQSMMIQNISKSQKW